MSRLLFNLHVVVPTQRFVKTLNLVYMRVLRRMAGCMRYGPNESDYKVRRKRKMPSIECVLARARLRYVRRIVAEQPKALLALLAIRHKNQPLPWVTLVLNDLRALRIAVAGCNDLPDPGADPKR